MNYPNFRQQLRCTQQPAGVLISSVGQPAQCQPSATTYQKSRPLSGRDFFGIFKRRQLRL